MATRSVSEAMHQLNADLEGYRRQSDRARADAEGARQRLEGERQRVERMANSMRRMGERFAKELGNEFIVASHQWIAGLPAYLATQEYPERIIVRVKGPSEWFVKRAIEWVGEKSQEWSSQSASVRLQEFIAEIEMAHADDLRELKKNLAEAAAQLGMPSLAMGELEDEETLSWLLRSSAGFLAGGPLGAIVGSTMGWQGVLTNLGVNAGLGFAAALAGFAIPVVGWVGIAAVIAAAQIVLGQSGIQDRIRGKVVEELRKVLPGKMIEAGEVVSKTAAQQTSTFAGEIKAGASAIIEQLVDGAKALERAARATEAEREARTAEIGGALQVLEKLAAQLQQARG